MLSKERIYNTVCSKGMEDLHIYSRLESEKLFDLTNRTWWIYMDWYVEKDSEVQLSSSTTVQKWCLPPSGKDNTAMNVSPHFRNLSDEKLYTYMGKKKLLISFFSFLLKRSESKQCRFILDKMLSTNQNFLQSKMLCALPFLIR